MVWLVFFADILVTVYHNQLQEVSQFSTWSLSIYTQSVMHLCMLEYIHKKQYFRDC